MLNIFPYARFFKCALRFQIDRFENFFINLLFPLSKKTLINPSICRMDDFNVSNIITPHRQKLTINLLQMSFLLYRRLTPSVKFSSLTINSVYLIVKNDHPKDNERLVMHMCNLQFWGVIIQQRQNVFSEEESFWI